MSEVSMSDILDDEAPAALEVDPNAPVPEEKNLESMREDLRVKEAQAQGKVRDPATGQWVKPKAEPEVPVEEPKAEEKPPAPQDELTPKEKAFLAKAMDAQRKLQEVQAKLKALEKPPEPEKTFWDDPEAKVGDLQKQIQQSALSARLNTAEIIARQRHADFDEKLVVFRELLSENPAIAGQWLQAPDPAEYAYKLAVNHTQLKEVGDLDSLKAKIEADTRAKVKAEMEAEYKAKAEKTAKEREAIPRSLSDARGAPVNRTVWAGPPSMDEILKP